MNISNNCKPIVLVGLMGSGKSTIGSKLANYLSVPFFDTDKEIEKISCCSISDLFYYAGEEYFREVETKTIASLLNDGRMKVIATGGGAFVNYNIRKMVKEKAVSVWIKADLNVLLERVSRRNDRPLLENGDKKMILESLASVRYPIYSEADIIVSSDNKTQSETANNIINAMRKYEEKNICAE